MDYYYHNTQSRPNSWSYHESFKNAGQITPSVQSHLKLVYLTLCGAVGASAAGAYLHVLWNVGGILTSVGCLACVAWMLMSPVYQNGKRMGLLMAAATLEGASIGPLIKLAVDFDVSLLVTAFVGTALAFACFSLAALVAKRQQFLYLGGLLGSGISILYWLRFASSLFGGSVAMLNAEIYFGLLVFLGYIVYDTQMIVERAFSGDHDYIKHALELFTDFVAVFVRILIIMLKNANEEKKKERKRRD